MSKPSFESILLKDLHDPKLSSGSHTTPIYATSTYVYPSVEGAQKTFSGEEDAYIYNRWHNPGTDAVEKKLAMLEAYDLDQEAKAIMFSSGMAAISAALEACLEPGGTIVTQGNLYGAADELMKHLSAQMNLNLKIIDVSDLDQVSDALNSTLNSSVLYLETPSNPTLNAYDIAALSELAHQFDAKVLVDNTFATPYLQRPLALRADVVIHSTTKFLNGHGTALGGVVVSSDLDWVDGPLNLQRKLKGATPSPFDAWLLNNGLKTLNLRMDRHCDNTKAVSEFLNQHPAVGRVNYLGFADHPDHEIAKKQMKDFGGVISFELKGGLNAGAQMMDAVKELTLTASLGTPDTLIQHPASMTHFFVDKAQREANGISDGLIRLSVGLEAPEDIIRDLEQSMLGLA